MKTLAIVLNLSVRSWNLMCMFRSVVQLCNFIEERQNIPKHILCFSAVYLPDYELTMSCCRFLRFFWRLSPMTLICVSTMNTALFIGIFALVRIWSGFHSPNLSVPLSLASMHPFCFSAVDCEALLHLTSAT